jgi:hypothetical protein
MIVNAYLSREHFEDREDSCPMVALPSDVSRAGARVKEAFEQVLRMMVGAFAANLSGGEGSRQERALTLASVCVGAMVLSRSVADPELAARLRKTARDHVLGASGWGAKAKS